MVNRINQPQKDIFVFIPDQGRSWTSGDVVRGAVRVRPTSRPQRVNISFRGRMKCSITRSNGSSSTTYKEKPEFFRRDLELFASTTSGPSYDIVSQGVTDDDRVELPFEFTWPETTEQPTGPKWLPSPYFQNQPGGTLPPTFIRGAANVQLVEYFLEARLFCIGKYSPSQEVRCPLRFRPSSPIPDPIPLLPNVRTIYSTRGITVQTHRLYPDYDPNEGFRAWLKARWDRDKAPTANFKVNVSCPSVVVSRAPIVLTFQLEHGERSKDIPDPPPVYLRRINECIMDKSFDVDEELLLYDGATVTTNKFPVHIAPGFQTYGLSLDHKVKVELWVECAREKLRYMPVQGPIMIVEGNTLRRDSAPPPPSHSNEFKATETSAEAPPPADEDTAPPPYQVLSKN
ncbi:hypothetical protein BU23DRAFT_603956 [Bimuria novae-zelandiae CBS 107.79]|uniref:Arrestin-like N-terminal domain-containing protein n=1 Tax=Bimuria novae-zelandiae CBS 107.79 TaxID=1447943 RepID=A0A6A5UMK5_9PLEO|nr:hypothetical protein BU23DRAFT_603956 [Bimuria novae-zelandiae CBS 107.79]